MTKIRGTCGTHHTHALTICTQRHATRALQSSRSTRSPALTSHPTSTAGEMQMPRHSSYHVRLTTSSVCVRACCVLCVCVCTDSDDDDYGTAMSGWRSTTLTLAVAAPPSFTTHHTSPKIPPTPSTTPPNPPHTHTQPNTTLLCRPHIARV